MIGNFKYMMPHRDFSINERSSLFINGFIDSYEWMPLSNELFGRIYEGRIPRFLAHTFAETFMLAIQMSAPLIAAMFLTDVGLGFLTKTAPQYNVFVIGIPIKIIVGFLMMPVYAWS